MPLASVVLIPHRLVGDGTDAKWFGHEGVHFDILPTLKREESSVGSFETAKPFRDDGRPKVFRITSGAPTLPRR